jgi:DNA polymerase III sliding clamp (beta) subunit (PCNA family)
VEFNIDAAAFKSAKDILPGVIGDKPVLFTAQEGELRIESFDETKEVALTFDANTSGSGSVLFDSKYLPALTAFTGDVGVQVKDKIQFKNPHRKFQVPILPWLGISRQPRVTIGTVTVELADLKELFRKVLFASGRGVVRAYDFSCILLECDSSSMRAVAADTRVIAFAELSKGSSYIGKSKLPRDVVDVIRKFDAPDSMATMTFYEDGGISLVVAGSVLAEFSILEYRGKFPPYADYVGVRGSTTLTGNAQEFMGALKGFMDIDGYLAITLSRSGEYVQKPARFYVSDSDGAFMEFFPNLEWKGDDVKVKINLKTIYECLSQATGQATLHLNGDVGPIFLTDETSGAYLCRMMPYSEHEKR